MLTKLEQKLAGQIHNYDATKQDFEDNLMQGGNPQLISDMQEYLKFIGVAPIPEMPYLLCTAQDYLTRAIATEMLPTYKQLEEWYMAGNAAEMRLILLDLGVTAAKTANFEKVIHLTGMILQQRGFNPFA
jgi:hypothetical protein